MTTVAFLIDPIETLNPKKDSTIEMIRQAHRLGLNYLVASSASLAFDGKEVTAEWLKITLKDDAQWYEVVGRERHHFKDIQIVLMRKDPPFDNEYLYMTQLLDRLPPSVQVINAPQALRDHNEKLALLEFIEFAPPSFVTNEVHTIHHTIDRLKDTILKPLDSMGGQGIFRLRTDDPNRNMIVDMATQKGARHIMLQQYLPDIIHGDKRILVIDGEPIDFVLARMPAKGESRANLAAGGTGIAQPITAHERKIAQAVGAILAKRGLFLIGLDMIGDYLTEINVTSPTCFVEIRQQTGFNVAAHFWDKLLNKC